MGKVLAKIKTKDLLQYQITEFSDYYKHREYCVEKLQVPTMSEIRENLGDTLAEVFFDVCPEALKPLVGLTPPLEGTGDELWSSPSDLLIGKVCLKPPLTSKHMRALTHEGILGNLFSRKACAGCKFYFQR